MITTAACLYAVTHAWEVGDTLRTIPFVKSTFPPQQHVEHSASPARGDSEADTRELAAGALAEGSPSSRHNRESHQPAVVAVPDSEVVMPMHRFSLLDARRRPFYVKPELEEFLHAADSRPVVYIGVEPMRNLPPAAFAALVINACAAGAVRAVIGVRAVVGSEWVATEAEGTIHVTRAMSRGVMPEWFFPRVRAVVHSCSDETTNAAFLSGVPQVGVWLGEYCMGFSAHRVHTGMLDLPFES